MAYDIEGEGLKYYKVSRAQKTRLAQESFSAKPGLRNNIMFVIEFGL